MKNKILLIAVFLTLLLLGCSFPHYYYSPSAHNVPLFRERDEFSGLMAISMGAVNQGVEFQAGYSFPGHIALMTNYMNGGNNNSGTGYEDFSKYSYFEGAAGIYFPVKEPLILELYAGYGGGAQQHAFAYNEHSGGLVWHWIPDGKADISFTKFYIQPNIGVRTKLADAAFSLKLGCLNYTQIDVFNSVYRMDEINTLKQFERPFVIEPALTLRLGKGAVKGQMQMVFSKNLTNPEPLYEVFRVNFGMFFSLPKKKAVNQTTNMDGK